MSRSSNRSEDDPQVQRNGFEMLAAEYDLGPETEGFLKSDLFRPDETFEENLERWFDYVEEAGRKETGLVRQVREEEGDGS